MSRRRMNEAMLRPLFVDPSDDIEREDPWSGPLGFMIGGMALPTRPELAQQFFLAAQALVESIRRRDCTDYTLVNPVLYLYRHSLELVLKGVIRSTAQHHRLDNLANDLSRFIKERSGHQVPSWITARLKEIANIDPGSTAFRYAENRVPGVKGPVPVEGELYVDLCHLQHAMTVLFEHLSMLIGYDKGFEP